jgi:N-methylhydantoinase A
VNFSALGMLMAEWRQDFVRTLFGQLGKVAAADAERAFAELRQAGEEILLSDRFEPGVAHFAFAADLRYRGQEHTIPIPVPDAAGLTTDTAQTRLAFDEQHERRYGHAELGQLIEIVNLRLVVTVPRMEDTIGLWLSQPWEPTETAVEQRRQVVFEDPTKPADARVLWRPALPAGAEIVGPAVIEEPNSTILVHPGDTARVTAAGHIVITLAAQE